MAFSRHRNTPKIDYSRQYGTTNSVSAIREAVASGQLKVTQIILKESERLDTLAGGIYGNGRYWWILAAASNIGWGMQVPPGTVINVPSLSDVKVII